MNADRENELARMMHTYGSMLTGLCAGLLGDRYLAQDIVQETFLKAWKHFDTLRGGQPSEKAWLCRIAVNLCRDHQRTRWFRLVIPDETLMETIEAPQEDRSILEAVYALPARLREVVVLHYYQNMDATEMARVLGMTPSAVYRRLRQARGKLEHLLKGADDNE
ncbi:MAG: sigma-70 family RNA polymerase sigma factor [Clostridia bacterium]|nr:sigma-70 family RNA polymerase sigma factor [Clostridia bacterium]